MKNWFLCFVLLPFVFGGILAGLFALDYAVHPVYTTSPYPFTVYTTSHACVYVIGDGRVIGIAAVRRESGEACE